MDSKLAREIRKRLAAQKSLELAPKFDLAGFFFPKQFAFFRGSDKRFKVAVCSRRCLAEGTLIQTLEGPKPIEKINAGEWVYDENGAPIQVVKTFQNGNKEVTQVLHNGKVLVEATKDHVFLTSHGRIKENRQRPLKDLYNGVKIVRKEVDREHGLSVPHAYAIGALLGDGCSRLKHVSYVQISSATDLVPNAVASLISAHTVKKCHANNFTYNLYAPTMPIEYKEWCEGRYAHEKTCSVESLLKWDRPSRLAFLAGLIDTDGSVCNQADGLQIDISMQARPVIEAAQTLFLDLFNFRPPIIVDNRPKYKNGPVYTVRFKHNYFGKKVLKALDPYLVTPKKKWKPEYESKLENNYNAKAVGVKLGQVSIKPTYDIHVKSATNLYMLANGLITHNSGKTVGIVGDAIDLCLSEKRVRVLYVTLTRENCVEIIWPDLLIYLEKYKVQCKINQQRLNVTFANGSVLSCAGAKDKKEIGKFRGRKLRRIYIDEAQNFPTYLQSMIEEDLIPTLRDLRGEMIVTGTPGPLKRGFFYDIATNGRWESHNWTAFENPHMHNPEGLLGLPVTDLERTLEEERAATGHNKNDPKYIRETYGQWTDDTNALVFKFDAARNVTLKAPAGLTYIMGVDLGFNDADALAVLGYSYETNRVYLVEELVTRKQGITELVAQIELLRTKYEPVKIVMDAGGLGKKIQEEIQRRYTIPLQAADKNRKLEYIELLNDDLRTGRFQALPGSHFEADCYLVQWDRSVEDPSKLVVSKQYHSDICDSVLYAWRECNHYIKQDHQVQAPKNSNLYMDQLEAKEAEQMQLVNEGSELEWGVDEAELDQLFED